MWSLQPHCPFRHPFPPQGAGKQSLHHTDHQHNHHTSKNHLSTPPPAAAYGFITHICDTNYSRWNQLALPATRTHTGTHNQAENTPHMFPRAQSAPSHIPKTQQHLYPWLSQVSPRGHQASRDKFPGSPWCCYFFIFPSWAQDCRSWGCWRERSYIPGF